MHYAVRTLGFKVNHDELDFFENNLGVVIVSNPPFSKLPQIVERLAHLNKCMVIIYKFGKTLVRNSLSRYVLSCLLLMFPRGVGRVNYRRPA